MNDDWKKTWGSKIANPPRICVRCEGKYVPSATSHETKCGICAPYKNMCHSRATPKRIKVAKPKIRPLSWYQPRAKEPDPKLPVGTNLCKCSGCNEYFGGVASFDLHRVVGSGAGRDRACLPPSEVADKHNRPVLRLNDRGYWVRSFVGGSL